MLNCPAHRADLPRMTIRPRSEPPVVDSTRREGCDVLLMGKDWTITEVLRTIGDLASRLTVELRDDKDGFHLILAGHPEPILTALMVLPVVGKERDRVVQRLLPRTTFTEHDLRSFRSPTTL
jgi:hypothetical protein